MWPTQAQWGVIETTTNRIYAGEKARRHKD